MLSEDFFLIESLYLTNKPIGFKTYLFRNIEKIKITAFVSSVGPISIEKHYKRLDFKTIEQNPVRCADPDKSIQMEDYIKEIKKNGDTVGGVISCVIQDVPIGLGEPVFDKLHAELGLSLIHI